MVGVVGAALRGFGRALKLARKKTKNLSPLGLDYPVIKSVAPKVHKTKLTQRLAESKIGLRKAHGKMKKTSQDVWNKAQETGQILDEATKKAKEVTEKIKTNTKLLLKD